MGHMHGAAGIELGYTRVRMPSVFPTIQGAISK
jgi:hypothetical protein